MRLRELKSTADCVEFLKEKYPDVKGSWKRVRKYSKRGIVLRLFQNSTNTCVVATNKGIYEDHQLSDSVFSNNELINNLRAAAGQIKHGGDYGNLYFNMKNGKVHWECGDGDGCEDDEFGCTSLRDVKTLLSVEGVTSVDIGAECGPTSVHLEKNILHSDGWVYLGKFGEEV